jgi:hypothetical protein
MKRTWISKVSDAAIEPVLERPSANPTLKAAQKPATRILLPSLTSRPKHGLRPNYPFYSLVL